jgi:hypothetical protein
MSKRITKTERMILDFVDRAKYNVYRCPIHGVFAQSKFDSRNQNGECPYGCGFTTAEEFVEN